jgi:fatty-acid desaturase
MHTLSDAQMTSGIKRQQESQKDLAEPNYLYCGWFALVHLFALLAVPFFTWQNLFIALALFAVTGCFGITLGFHRLFSHRSFKTYRPVAWFLALCGTLAFQGGILGWVARHRMHHAMTDTDEDPHNARRGFWYSHIGWLLRFDPKFDEDRKLKAYARDIDRDPVLRFLSQTWVVAAVQIVLLIAFLATMGIGTALWAVFMRLFIGYHSTWLVNSAAHKFGYRTYVTDEDSKNCWWVALLTFGEGWHNNHHYDQKAARAGRKPWEFDPTYGIIKMMQSVGLAWDVHQPIDARAQNSTSQPQMAAQRDGSAVSAIEEKATPNKVTAAKPRLGAGDAPQGAAPSAAAPVP